MKGLADAPAGTGSNNTKKRPTPALPPLKQHPPPLKKAKKSQDSSVLRGPASHSQLAQRLTQPKRPPMMPPLPTEPEPPEDVIRGGNGKEDNIELYGTPMFGDHDNNSGDGDYGAYTETELQTDDDSSYPAIDQVCQRDSFIEAQISETIVSNFRLTFHSSYLSLPLHLDTGMYNYFGTFHALNLLSCLNLSYFLAYYLPIFQVNVIARSYLLRFEY